MVFKLHIMCYFKRWILWPEICGSITDVGARSMEKMLPITLWFLKAQDNHGFVYKKKIRNYSLNIQLSSCNTQSKWFGLQLFRGAISFPGKKRWYPLRALGIVSKCLWCPKCLLRYLEDLSCMKQINNVFSQIIYPVIVSLGHTEVQKGHMYPQHYCSTYCNSQDMEAT